MALGIALQLTDMLNCLGHHFRQRHLCSWADLREESHIRSAPVFLIEFRPSGARGGPREPRERIWLER